MKIWMALMLAGSPLWATTPDWQVLSGYTQLSTGQLDNLSLTSDGELIPAPRLTRLSPPLQSGITAILQSKSDVYVATAAPAQVVRIRNNGSDALLKSTSAVVTKMVPIEGGVAVLTAPQGKLHLIRRGEDQEVQVPLENLLSAARLGRELLLSGGGKDGARLVLLNLDTLKTRILTDLPTSAVQSMLVTPQGDVYLGAADSGVVYLWSHQSLKSVLFEEADEVTALAQDAQGNLYASFMTNQGKPASKIVRLATDGSTLELFRSDNTGVYDLCLTQQQEKLMAAMGPVARVYEFDLAAHAHPRLLRDFSGTDARVVSRLSCDVAQKLTVATGPDGSVYTLDLQRSENQGSYNAPVVDVKSQARFLDVQTLPSSAQVAIRTGNTPQSDESWSGFSSLGHQPLVGRFAQTKIELHNNQKIDQIRLGYLRINRAPRISAVRVLPPNERLAQLPAVENDSKSVVLDASAFSRPNDTVIDASKSLPRQGVLTKEEGIQTVYVAAQDPDNDRLRYRFYLREGSANTQKLLKDWSDEPFVVISQADLQRGLYRVAVDVDDQPDNSQNPMSDFALSSVIQVIPGPKN